MKTYKILLFLLLAACCGACRKDAPELMNPVDVRDVYSPSKTFESFWHAMNNGYIFWDIDPVDWDAVYDEYMPRFRELDTRNVVSNEELYILYEEITKNLVDTHLSLTVYNYYGQDSDVEIYVDPGYGRLYARPDVHYPITLEQRMGCIEEYKNDGRITEFVEGTSEKAQISAYSFRLDGDIICFYFSGFAFYDVIDSEGDPVWNVLVNYLELLKSTKSIKGVILDLRGNGGGYLNDMNYVLQPLLSESITPFELRSKCGLGRLDYSAWVPTTIAANPDGGIDPDAKVVALVDMWSASMGEMAPMAIRSRPNSCIIGERTFGATGPLVGDYTFSYAGSVKNDGFDLYMSSTMLRGSDGAIYESVGIEPDIESPYNKSELDSGVDGPFERALTYISQGR